MEMAARISNISWSTIPVGMEWFFIQNNLEKVKIIKTCFCFSAFNHVHFKCAWGVSETISVSSRIYERGMNLIEVSLMLLSANFTKSSGDWIIIFSENTARKTKFFTQLPIPSIGPFAIMTLVIISYNFEILRENSCQVKYIPQSELRGATIAPQMNDDVVRKMRVNLLDLVHYFQNQWMRRYTRAIACFCCNSYTTFIQCL